MSAESELPPAQRTLQDAPSLAPPEQEARRLDRGPAPEKTYFEDIVKLPGFDHQPRRCQPYRPVGFCRQNGHVALAQSPCGNRGCPEHWTSWLETNVQRGVERLAAYRYVQEGAGKRLLHVVFSPDQDRRWSADRVYGLRSEVYDVADEMGIRGGRVYVHPYRTNERGDALFETATESGEWDREAGRWKLLRDTAEDWGEMRRYTEAAPHYHGLVAIEDFDPEAVPEGWVVKNVRSLSRFHINDVEAYRDMARVGWYLGTHSAHQQGRQATTWFGEMHPVLFDPEEELTTAEWSQIQEMAERAVQTRPGEGPGEEPRECRRDGCESVVEPVERLSEYMEDREWWESLAPKQRVRLRAVSRWLVEEADRPPPGRLGSRESLLSWLEKKGGQLSRTGSPRPERGRQSSLSI